MVVIKRYILLLVALVTLIIPLLSFPAFSISNLDDNGYVIYPVVTDPITSKDGLYRYVIDDENGEAYFYASLAEDITVLNIPDEIDGHPITGIHRFAISSECLTRINFGKNIKAVFKNGLDIFTRKSDAIPLCTINFNEGLEFFSKHSKFQIFQSDYYIDQAYKVMIFPKSLEYIADSSLYRDHIDNIVFQSNPKTGMNAISVNDREDYENSNTENVDYPTNVYFTGDATNSSPFTFNYEPYNAEHDLWGPLTFPSPNVTIFHKPGAKGFDQFKVNTYEEYITEYSQNWKVPSYTVKEYTDEWWKNIKEIETVTLSAQNLDMKSGEKQTLAMDFAPQDAYDNRVFFVSLNTDVADVDMNTGAITAKSTGTATVRAVAASGVYADCVVKVNGGGNATESTTDKTAVSGTSTEVSGQTNKNPDNTTFMTKLSENRILVSVAAVVVLGAAVVIITIRKRKSA